MLPRAEIQQKIKLFLYEQLAEDGGIAACLIIHSCNNNKEKVRTVGRTSGTKMGAEVSVTLNKENKV